MPTPSACISFIKFVHVQQAGYLAQFLVQLQPRVYPRQHYPQLDISAQRLRVLAQHYNGNQALARHNAEQVIQRMAHSGHLNRFAHGIGVQYDQSVASLTVLARILWLQGFPEQAWRTASQALELAQQINHGRWRPR